ncbi:MAG: type II toxin-antitoxin system RelE/ParE family toxin [Methylobacteriaceae bacterium]|nr:type II toxin-antitoxin system RelE/ParE family toxin [Methylobacteriaceae bacterium]
MIHDLGEPHVRQLERKLWELRLTGRDGIARALYVTAIGRRKFPGIYADPLMVTMHHFMFEIEGCVDEHDAGDDPGSGRARKSNHQCF